MQIKRDKTINYLTYMIVLAFVLFNYKAVFSFLRYVLTLGTPFYLAIAIAYLLNLPMVRIEKFLNKKFEKLSKGKLRALSITLTLICALIILSIFGFIIIPRIMDSILLIVENLIIYLNRLVDLANGLLNSMGLSYYLNIETIMNSIETNFNLSDFITKMTTTFSQSSFSLISHSISIVSFIINIIASFMMAIYALASKEKHITQLKKIIIFVFGYKPGLSIMDIGIEANHYYKSFISGQMLEACIFMAILYVVMKICGTPFPELIAVFSGLCALVPIFGAYFAYFVGVILILAIDPNQALIFTILYICVQQFEGNVIYPHVVGDAVGISGLFVLLSLTVFGSLFGFLGMLIAVPSMALIYAVGSRVINFRLYRNRIEVTETGIRKIPEDEY